MGGVCPGLPSPSGVHLVTHPLHRAQYMTDWQRAREEEREEEREGEKEREREREHVRWGRHWQSLTGTGFSIL